MLHGHSHNTAVSLLEERVKAMFAEEGTPCNKVAGKALVKLQVMSENGGVYGKRE